MKTAKFIRKAVDIGDLKYQLERTSNKESAYIIEKTIELDLQEWEFLCQDFFGYKSYIEENLDLMKYEDKVFHCLLVTTKCKDYGILIESEGYKYARYTSIVELGGDN